jgi:hypothetical protein
MGSDGVPMIAEASVSRKERVQMLRELVEDVIYTNITKASLKKVWIISENDKIHFKGIITQRVPKDTFSPSGG